MDGSEDGWMTGWMTGWMDDRVDGWQGAARGNWVEGEVTRGSVMSEAVKLTE